MIAVFLPQIFFQSTTSTSFYHKNIRLLRQGTPQGFTSTFPCGKPYMFGDTVNCWFIYDQQRLGNWVHKHPSFHLHWAASCLPSISFLSLAQPGVGFIRSMSSLFQPGLNRASWKSLPLWPWLWPPRERREVLQVTQEFGSFPKHQYLTSGLSHSVHTVKPVCPLTSSQSVSPAQERHA